MSGNYRFFQVFKVERIEISRVAEECESPQANNFQVRLNVLQAPLSLRKMRGKRMYIAKQGFLIPKWIFVSGKGAGRFASATPALCFPSFPSTGTIIFSILNVPVPGFTHGGSLGKYE